MKASPLFLTGLLAAAGPLAAAWSPAGVEMTVAPELPAALRATNFTEARVVFALAVDEQGRLGDHLVVAASHAELMPAALAALRQWRFQPARADGVAVPARLTLTVELNRSGVVVGRSLTDFFADRAELVTGRRLDFQVCPAAEMDGLPVAITRVAPAPAQTSGGRVRVHFFIDEEGNVRLPAVGADAAPELAAVAVDAIQRWKFAPVTRRGRPVLVAATQDFLFPRPP